MPLTPGINGQANPASGMAGTQQPAQMSNGMTGGASPLLMLLAVLAHGMAQQGQQRGTGGAPGGQGYNGDIFGTIFGAGDASANAQQNLGAPGMNGVQSFSVPGQGQA